MSTWPTHHQLYLFVVHTEQSASMPTAVAKQAAINTIAIDPTAADNLQHIEPIQLVRRARKTTLLQRQ